MESSGRCVQGLYHLGFCMSQYILEWLFLCNNEHYPLVLQVQGPKVPGR